MSSTSNQRSPVSTQNMDTSCSNSSSSTSSISLVMLTAHTHKQTHSPPTHSFHFRFSASLISSFVTLLLFQFQQQPPTSVPSGSFLLLCPLCLSLSLSLCVCVYMCVSKLYLQTLHHHGKHAQDQFLLNSHIFTTKNRCNIEVYPLLTDDLSLKPPPQETNNFPKCEYSYTFSFFFLL